MTLENKNFFMVPNDYQDAKCRIRIPGQARQVLDVIERFTLGWNKREADVSFKTFRERTGMDDRNIMRGRKVLLKMGIITSTQKGTLKRVHYRIQMDYAKWKPLSKTTVDKPLSKTTVKTTVKKDSKPLSKTTAPSIKDTSLNTLLLKTEESRIITQLKTRKGDLEEDLKNKGRDDPKQYLIDGIRDINERLGQLEAREDKATCKKERKAIGKALAVAINRVNGQEVKE